jgi:diacylglycerol kinase
MKKTIHSLRSAVEGLIHALKTERNLRHFLLGHILLMLIGIWMGIDFLLVLFLSIFAAFFIVVELMNTAMERLTDTIDDLEKSRSGGHYHAGIKMAKDVAAASSLIALMIYGAIIITTAIAFFISWASSPPYIN